MIKMEAISLGTALILATPIGSWAAWQTFEAWNGSKHRELAEKVELNAIQERNRLQLKIEEIQEAEKAQITLAGELRGDIREVKAQLDLVVPQLEFVINQITAK